MGSAMSALLETASGTSKKAQDGQGAAQTATGATEKKQQGEPSTTTPPTTSQQVPSVPPHNFYEIVAKAQGKDGRPFDGELLEQVLSNKGIYLLDGNTMRYWVVDDNKTTNSKANCFMLLARGLSIIWGSDQRYWSWRKLLPNERTEETAGDTETDIEVACLEDVCWLEIRGWLEMSHLSPGITYDVAFVAKLAPNAYGWSVPVDLQLKIPNGTPKQRKVNLWRMDGKKNNEWTELKVGEVEVPPAPAGQKEEKLEIAMLRLGGEWKSGLELMGIKITPQVHQ